MVSSLLKKERGLEDAKKRAEYYINENPWAAPEVKESEQLILEEVNRLEGLNN